MRIIERENGKTTRYQLRRVICAPASGAVRRWRASSCTPMRSALPAASATSSWCAMSIPRMKMFWRTHCPATARRRSSFAPRAAMALLVPAQRRASQDQADPNVPIDILGRRLCRRAAEPCRKRVLRNCSGQPRRSRQPAGHARGADKVPSDGDRFLMDGATTSYSKRVGSMPHSVTTCTSWRSLR